MVLLYIIIIIMMIMIMVFILAIVYKNTLVNSDIVQVEDPVDEEIQDNEDEIIGPAPQLPPSASLDFLPPTTTAPGPSSLDFLPPTTNAPGPGPGPAALKTQSEMAKLEKKLAVQPVVMDKRESKTPTPQLPPSASLDFLPPTTTAPGPGTGPGPAALKTQSEMAKLEEENKRKLEEENKRKLQNITNERERQRIIQENEEKNRKLEEENKRKVEENKRKLEQENKRKLEQEKIKLEQEKIKLEEERKAEEKRKVEEIKLKMSSEIWDVILLGKNVNTEDLLNFEQLYTMKMSATTTFYDIVKNNIKWINSESVTGIAWSTSDETWPSYLSVYNELFQHKNHVQMNDKTTRLIDVCWDNEKGKIRPNCQNKTIYIKINYNKDSLKRAIGKELMTPVIGIPIYSFTTFPDGKWFKIKYNQTNKTYTFNKIIQTPSKLRGIQGVEPKWTYTRKFYDDGIFRIKEHGKWTYIDRQEYHYLYEESEFIIKTVDDKFVMYAKDGRLISGMRSGSGSFEGELISNPIFVPKDKIHKIDYENAKFGLLGAMPFLHSFSNKGEIVPNYKYNSPNKKYYAIFIPNNGLYVKDVESNNYKVRILTPESTYARLYSSPYISVGIQRHFLEFYKDNTLRNKKQSFTLDPKNGDFVGYRRNFALVVTDLGELLCLDLYDGQIVNDFGKPFPTTLPKGIIGMCRANDPDENSRPTNPTKYLVSKGVVPTIQKIENKDIYDSINNNTSGVGNPPHFYHREAIYDINIITPQIQQDLWIKDCKNIRVNEPLIKPYKEHMRHGHPEYSPRPY